MAYATWVRRVHPGTLRRPSGDCRRRWVCLRVHEWRAWCACGWDRAYGSRYAAKAMLDIHTGEGHGGVCD